ncbi:MAG: substrate-binding domain-containing protein [Burkholderiales bacterium]|nr:substrate-binding domain-containing protein [Burkholderiales bacterium]
MAILIVSFAGAGKFYVPLIIAGGALLLAFAFLHLFHFVASKKMKKIWLIFLSLMVVSCAVHEGRNAYDRSITRMREGNVDLKLYAPYAENTRAAALEGASTLRLETDLPLLDGATALYPVYSAFAQAVYPQNTYHLYSSEVACHNTIWAYDSLINKKVDIIFVAAPSKEQLEAAEKAGVTFRYTPIGKEAFVFFVNTQNPVEDLTIEQLQAIYSGAITNWKNVGGKDEAIRPFQRNENSGSQTAFVHFMQGKMIAKPPMEDVVRGMGGIVAQAADYANYGNSIGFSFRFYVNEMVKNEEVKILKINGVYPDRETIKNETYPLAASFFAITLADNEKSNVSKLLDWMASEQGQYLVEKTGYVSIK